MSTDWDRMSLEEKGWAVLEDGTTLHKIAHRENLPCCTLCAMWCLDIEQDVCESTVSRYAATDIDWWKAANVYDAEKPWSALVASQAKLGGDIEYTEEVDALAPSLTPGMEDDQVKNGSYGHTYLAYADKEGKGVTIIQSSIAKGYRVNKGTWEGNAGLKGFSVGVLTLPV